MGMMNLTSAQSTEPTPLVLAAASLTSQSWTRAPTWILGVEGASCTATCAAYGLTCGRSTSNLEDTDTAAEIVSAAWAAGHTCSSTVGWGYDANPGICTNAGCCGDGSCTGTCAFGRTGPGDCDAVHSHYSRLCYCQAMLPLDPLDKLFHCYSDTNAYEGFGSSNDIDDDAASLKGVSMSTCQQHCRNSYECLCVVYYKCPWWGCEHGHVDGQCWRRASCTFSRAKHNDPGFEMCDAQGRL